MKVTRQQLRQIERRLSHDEVDTEGSWAVSYGDMITLLLTFFIIFFSIKPIQEQNEKAKEKGLQVSFIQSLMSQPKSLGTNAEDKLGTYGTVKKSQIGNNKSKEAGLSNKLLENLNAQAFQKGDHVVVEFPKVSFFNSSQTDLTADGQMALKSFAEKFMPYAGYYQVSIRAFTDIRKVRTNKNYKFKDNLELSALRGVAAMRVLQRSGLSPEQIKIGGYGEVNETLRDLASENIKNKREKELSLSRKIVLVVEPLESQGGSNETNE